ncbi:MAG: MBL fold metallo-hydrolase [Proteobacteria bacterium]|nr:MBL fold metallo-hydrolase [Pseudomonadota bacterium]MBU1741316.1 MBL fold metallo-hydrolase [Pseudomonadota bacterium]
MIEITPQGEVTRIMMSQTMGGRPLYWVAAYLVDGLLIDTGCHHTRAELLDLLADREVSQVVNTHHHEDHVGADRLLKDERGLLILAHPASAPLIENPPAILPYQQLVWGDPEPCPVDLLGDTVRTPGHEFLVVETPGHCPDHVALVEPATGWCFSGDLFVTQDQKTLRADEDIRVIRQSLQKLVAWDVDRLILFTSLGQVHEHGRRAIAAFLDHLAGLEEQVLALGSQGHEPPAIVERIMGRESSLAQLTNGHYSYRNMVRSLLAGGSARDDEPSPPGSNR